MNQKKLATTALRDDTGEKFITAVTFPLIVDKTNTKKSPI